MGGMLDVRLHTFRLAEPFRIAHGTSATRQVVRVSAGGAVGEAPFVPYYGESPEDTVLWLSGTGGRETRAARLALDLLRLDQADEAPALAAARRLGPGRTPEAIRACRSFSIPTDLREFAERVRAVARQFRVLKLKLGSGDLGHDEAVVAAARTAAPQACLLADVNGGWSVTETLAMLPRLAALNLRLVEQPFHHNLGLEAWRELAERRRALPGPQLPVYADESAQSAADVATLAGLAQGVNVKLLKCASFAGAVEMMAAARRQGLGVLLGCMIESSVGVTAAAHLAPWADYVDLDGHLYLADDDFQGVAFDANGRLVMPLGRGLGVRPRQPFCHD